VLDQKIFGINVLWIKTLIGNAVPVLLAKQIGEAIISFKEE